jgi:hypothetical protein
VFIFEVLFLIGAIGFGAMALLAGLHSTGDHGSGHHGHGHHGLDAPSAHGDHQSALGAHLKTLQQRGGHPVRTGSLSGRLKSILFLSPLDVFALCLGAGTAGLALRHVLSPALLPWIAALAAVLLDYGVVRPLLALAFRFASKPSEALEDTVARSAQAISRFDRDGRGLVALTLDGQTVQLLAQLDADDRARGVEVHRGDEVVVLEVDPHRNACRVTRQLSS